MNFMGSKLEPIFYKSLPSVKFGKITYFDSKSLCILDEKHINLQICIIFFLYQPL